MEKKYLEAIKESEMVERLNDSITSLLSLLRNGDEKTGVPFSVYSDIFTQVLNMHVSPDNKKKLQTYISKQITSFMSDKIIPAFKNSKDSGKELVDKFIKNWLITNPSSAIYLIFTQNVYEEKSVQDGLHSYLVDFFKKKSESKSDKEKDEFVSSADSEHFQKYGFLPSAIFELPVDVQQVLSIVVEMGKEPHEFDEDKEFSKYVGKYLLKIVDEKKREEAMAEFYNSQGSGGYTYSGGGGGDNNSSYSSGGSYSSYRDYLDEDDTTSLDNAEFFQGKKGSKFGDGTVDKIIKEWFGKKYDEMEERHNYVQFFFPIRESGMSSQQALSKHESELFKKDSKMRDNLIGIYELMLDFYGIKLKDRSTGELERNKNWEERYRNLNENGHNNLRVTRILKCLGLTGLEHFKKHLVKLFITEVFQNKQLENVKSSLVKYWMPTLRNEADLVEAEELVKKITGKRVSRKCYDKEKRTWANICFPLKKEEKKDEKEDKKDEKEDKKDEKKEVKKKDNDEDDGKTFYNRDDDDKSESESILDPSSPRRRFVYNWNDSDDDKNDSDDDKKRYKSYHRDSDDDEDLDMIDEDLEEDFEKKYS